MAVILLCCLLHLLKPPTVWGQQATSIIELRESAEPESTDHTGDIVSFTAVGSGVGSRSDPPRPWICYTTPSISPDNAQWLDPGGNTIPSGPDVAPDDSVITRPIDGTGIVLSRGTNYLYPDGDYCCVLTIDGTESERRCVTFTPCPTLTTPSNGMIAYNPTTNVATYSCDTGYTPTGNGEITCLNDRMWSATVTCTIVDCGALIISNGMVNTSSGTTFMSNAIYSCNADFILVGVSVRTCQADSLWSGAAPACCLVSPLNSATLAVIENNTQLLLSNIGEGDSSLCCHTELTTCCREEDNNGVALGDWVGPDGNSLSETSEEGFYVTREMSSVSLNLVEGSTVMAGSYCCQVPRSNGGMSTHCITVEVPVPPTGCTDAAAVVLGLLLIAAVVGNIVLVLIILIKTQKILLKRKHQAAQESVRCNKESPVGKQDAVYELEYEVPSVEGLEYEDVGEVPPNTIELKECPAYSPMHT